MRCAGGPRAETPAEVRGLGKPKKRGTEMSQRKHVVVRDVKLADAGYIETYKIDASNPRPATKGKIVGQIRQSLGNGKGPYPDAEGYYYVPKRSVLYGDIFETIDAVINSLKGN